MWWVWLTGCGWSGLVAQPDEVPDPVPNPTNDQPGEEAEPLPPLTGAFFDLADFNQDGHDDLLWAAADVTGIRFGPLGSGVVSLTPDVSLPFAYAAGVVPDVNGDGHPDVAIGAPLADALDVVAYVVSGKELPGEVVEVARVVSDPQLPPQLPRTLSGRDLTGDGVVDLLLEVWPTPGVPLAYVVPGPLSGEAQLTNVDTTVSANPVNAPDERVRMVGDLDGRGDVDLMGFVPAPFNGGVVGAVGFFGPMEASRDWSSADVEVLDPAPGLVAVDGVGDLNEDGVADIVAGDAAGFSVFMSPHEDILGFVDGLEEPVPTARFEALEPVIGFHAVPAGDVDGDGVSDLLVTLRQLPFENVVYVFRGPLPAVLTPELAYAELQLIDPNAARFDLRPGRDLDADDRAEVLLGLGTTVVDDEGNGLGSHYDVYVVPGDQLPELVF